MALDFLEGKIGPVPKIAIPIGIGGGLLLLLWRRRGGAPAPQEATDAFGGTGGGEGLARNNAAAYPSSGAPTDNATWVSRALNSLIGQNFDPTTASNALAKYTTGQDLTSDENRLVAEALRQLGAPPTPVGPVNILPNPGTNQPPSPPASGGGFEPQAPPVVATSNVPLGHSYHQVQPGEDLSSIGAQYGLSWETLNQWNYQILPTPDVGAQPTVAPGTVLAIPRQGQ